MYYSLRYDFEPKVVGVSNGAYQVELVEKYYDKETYSKLISMFTGNFTYENTYPDLDFLFYFKKLKSAKKTGFMSFCPYFKHCQFLIKKDVLDVFKRFNVQKFKDYDVLISEKSSLVNDESYIMFYCVEENWDYIDFKKTVFQSGGYGKFPVLEHRFSNVDELLDFGGGLKVRVLGFSDKFDRTQDYFITRLGGYQGVVSERLKRKLEEMNVTGMRFDTSIEFDI